jgi:hypothetical protein
VSQGAQRSRLAIHNCEPPSPNDRKSYAADWLDIFERKRPKLFGYMFEAARIFNHTVHGYDENISCRPGTIPFRLYLPLLTPPVSN